MNAYFNNHGEAFEGKPSHGFPTWLAGFLVLIGVFVNAPVVCADPPDCPELSCQTLPSDASLSAAGRWFVSTLGQVGATGQGTNGWADATRDLQAAIDAAHAHFNATQTVGEVWIAIGCYAPQPAPNSDDCAISLTSFVLRAGVHLIGGLDPCDPSRNEPDERLVIVSPPLRGTMGSGTVLLGTHNGMYFQHIMRAANAPATGQVIVPTNTRIDGVQFRNGQTMPFGSCLLRSPQAGAGLLLERGASPTIIRCTFGGLEAVAIPGSGPGGVPLYPADGRGGCLAALRSGDDAAGRLVIEQCSFFSTYSLLAGGAVFSEFGETIISRCDFTDASGGGFNVFTGSFGVESGQGVGGAIAVVPSTDESAVIEIRGCHFAKLGANLEGGAIYLDVRLSQAASVYVGVATFGEQVLRTMVQAARTAPHGSTITEPRWPKGGAISYYGNSASVFTMDRVEMSDVGSLLGGAAALQGGLVELRECVAACDYMDVPTCDEFNGNRMPLGGAVFSGVRPGEIGAAPTLLKITGSLLVGSRAYDGFGVYGNNATQCEIVNSTIRGSFRAPTLCELWAVDGPPSVVKLVDGSLTVANSIIWSTPPECPGGGAEPGQLACGEAAVGLGGGATGSVSHSVLATAWSGMGGENQFADPLFVGAGTSVWASQLSRCSPAIELGQNSEVPTWLQNDLAGGLRRVWRVDAGALEAQGREGEAAGGCPADLVDDVGQTPPDGFLTGSDFDTFVTYFFADDPRADIGNQATGGLPCDGAVTGVDFDLFVQLFFSGCGE